MSINVVVPGRVVPGDPPRVFVDIAARILTRDEEQRQEREAHARKQAELLERDRDLAFPRSPFSSQPSNARVEM
jgi:hypothetical protein